MGRRTVVVKLEFTRPHRPAFATRRSNATEMPMRPAPEHSIIFDRVTLSRGAKRVFDRLDLELSERCVGVVGDNGAGKSSLLRLINGLLRPDSGRVIVDGLSSADHQRDLLRKVGFVFQNPDHQIVFPTVLEELACGLRARGASAQEADAKARRVLAEHGCSAWEDAAVHELSDGQKQRLCILAVLALDPDILVLDEPFSSLDLPTRLNLIDMLHALPQRMIVASHDLDLLADLDRLVWLENGTVIGDGKPAAILSAYRERAFAGRRRLQAAQ